MANGNKATKLKQDNQVWDMVDNGKEKDLQRNENENGLRNE